MLYLLHGKQQVMILMKLCIYSTSEFSSGVKREYDSTWITSFWLNITYGSATFLCSQEFHNYLKSTQLSVKEDNIEVDDTKTQQVVQLSTALDSVQEAYSRWLAWLAPFKVPTRTRQIWQLKCSNFQPSPVQQFPIFFVWTKFYTWCKEQCWRELIMQRRNISMWPRKADSL